MIQAQGESGGGWGDSELHPKTECECEREHGRRMQGVDPSRGLVMGGKAAGAVGLAWDV